MSSHLQIASKIDKIYDGEDDFRDTDWRYWRAQQVRETKQNCTYDDKWVCRLVKYYTARDEYWKASAPGTSARQRYNRKLRTRFNDIHAAVNLYENDNRAKMLTEAALMDPKRSIADLAARLGCSGQMLQAYESLFFDIRTRLRNVLFIKGTVLHVLIAKGSAAADIDQLWKAMGFAYGVDILLSYADTTCLDPDVYALLDNMLKSMSARRSIASVIARPISGFNAHEVVQEHVMLRGKDDEVTGNSAEDQRNVFKQVMMSQLSLVGDLTGENVDKVEARAMADIKALAEGKVIDTEAE